MQIHAESEYVFPILGAKFGSEAGKHSRKDVACPAGGHPRITGRTEVSATVGRRQDGVKSLQDYESLPLLCGIECSFEAPALNVMRGRSEEPAHLSRMWREEIGRAHV